MDQSNAPIGQEEAPQGQITEKNTEERQTTGSASMEVLLQEEGLNLDFPKQGEIRTGVIASIMENEILVSVGTKSEGVISGKEKEQIPVETLDGFQVGQEIPVYVLNPEDPSGNLVLSYMRAREESDWLEAEKMKISGAAFDGEVIGYNKGGLIVPLGLLRGFVPASQVSVMRRSEGEETTDARWSKMVGEPIKVAVIEVDRTRHRLILSERSALQETRETIKDRLLDELQDGDIRVGRVTSLADFGAFVNIDGADGLVHLSEISWERIEHPSEVLKVGQEVKVKIIAVDQERKRIGLSIRQLLPDPWVVKASGLKEGQLVEGTITHLTKFGAFARLGEDMEGLIHISELSDQRINHPKEVVKEGDVVTLRVIKLDTERRRIGLSLRKVDSMAYANMDYAMMLSGESQAATPEAEVAEAVEVVEAAEAVEAVAVEEVVEAAEAAEEAEAVEAAEEVDVAEAAEGTDVVKAVEEVEAAEAAEEADVAEAAEEAKAVEAVEEVEAVEAVEEVEAAEDAEEADVAEAVEEVEVAEEAKAGEAVEEVEAVETADVPEASEPPVAEGADTPAVEEPAAEPVIQEEPESIPETVDEEK